MSQTSETSEARGGSLGVAGNGVDDWDNSDYDSQDDYNDQLDDTLHAIQLGDDSPEYWEMREYQIVGLSSWRSVLESDCLKEF